MKVYEILHVTTCRTFGNKKYIYICFKVSKTSENFHKTNKRFQAINQCLIMFIKKESISSATALFKMKYM